jgi:3-deoxy-D-manno-octulosonic-acid transferase
VQLGTAVLYGPELDKVRASVELLESCDAGACVRDAEQLGSRVEGWLADRGALRERGRRGRAELERHRGSADRTLALLERWAGVPPIAATPASD